LAQFQATKAAKEDVLRLLKTLNSALRDSALPEAHIDEAFDVWWPKLESQLKGLPPEESKAKTHRPDRELLEEILSLVRNQSRTSTESMMSETFVPSGLNYHDAMKSLREYLLLQTLKATRGNVRHAAGLLGVTRATLYQMMHENNINPKEFNAGSDDAEPKDTASSATDG
jgi:hypothetical protein